jgi:hypothetical protein
MTRSAAAHGWQPAVVARPEVGDEVVGHLGRAGWDARWVGLAVFLDSRSLLGYLFREDAGTPGWAGL